MGPVTPRRIRRFDFSGADKKLQYLLTVCHLDILFGRDDELVGVVGGRYYHGLGSTRLVVRSCRVHEVEDDVKLRKGVKKVEWDNVTVMGWDYTGSYAGEGSGSDSDDPTSIDDY